MKIAIGVFAKTPGLSPVKTRLAETFGEEGANTFYKLSVAAVSQNLKDTMAYSIGIHTKIELSVYWALAEEEGSSNSFWAEKPCFWTGEGGLGERLHQVTERLFDAHDYVFVMGTDSPQVGVNILKMALEKVIELDTEAKEKRETAIVGPCKDGGFYLFGMSHPLGKELWTSIPYSREDTCEKLVERLTEKGFELKFMPDFGDVDIEADLIQLKKELLENQDALNNEQLNLLNWLSANVLPENEVQSPTSRLCE